MSNEITELKLQLASILSERQRDTEAATHQLTAMKARLTAAEQERDAAVERAAIATRHVRSADADSQVVAASLEIYKRANAALQRQLDGVQTTATSMQALTQLLTEFGVNAMTAIQPALDRLAQAQRTIAQQSQRLTSLAQAAETARVATVRATNDTTTMAGSVGEARLRLHAAETAARAAERAAGAVGRAAGARELELERELERVKGAWAREVEGLQDQIQMAETSSAARMRKERELSVELASLRAQVQAQRVIRSTQNTVFEDARDEDCPEPSTLRASNLTETASLPTLAVPAEPVTLKFDPIFTQRKAQRSMNQTMFETFGL